MKTVIIDDENAAIKNLTYLLERYIHDITFIASSQIPSEGVTLIENIKPAVVFLDISMPGMNGFDLLHELKYKNFHLIFTTAHQQYAIQAIKHHATDYLLKPIDIDELLQVFQNINTNNNPQAEHHYHNEGLRLLDGSRLKIVIKEGLIYIHISDIIYIESNGNYSIFYTINGKKYVVSKNIGEYERILSTNTFFRIHKSYLINLTMVRKYLRNNGHQVELEGGALVEVARRKKDSFLQLMEGNVKSSTPRSNY